jgi:hypothetical protein
MGQRPLKLPRYVQAFVDRHGRARFYIRRRGFPRVALPGMPWSPEFMAKYHEVMATKPETDKDGQSYGDKSAVKIKSRHIEKMMEARADKPDSANGLRKVLREMMKVAKKLGWRDDDPTQGVKKIKPKKRGGFHRWTDTEIAKFEERHPVGSKARLAMTLGLHTGQARQDVILMGEQHIVIDAEYGDEVLN